MTFIECGAYGEAWRLVHMFPEQTVQAHRDLDGQILHPIHWGMFNLALPPLVRTHITPGGRGCRCTDRRAHCRRNNDYRSSLARQPRAAAGPEP